MQEILIAAGYEVHIGSLNPEITERTEIKLPSGKTLVLRPLEKQDDRVGVDDFFPCAVLLNNDLSSGRPEILENIDQTLLPPLDLGWADRFKTEHFDHYKNVSNEFSKMVDIDPWLINPMSMQCGPVDFKEREGLECLAGAVNTVLQETQRYYDQHDIACKPFAIVKSDSGTYGMAIMSVDTPEDVLNLNRKQRNKMSSAKEGLVAKQMLVQEGVYTHETINDAVAEPVVYMIHNQVVGGFYRVHTGKTATDNLNSPGMHFESLSFATSCVMPDQTQAPDASPNRFYAYGVVARLALLAAAREIADAKREAANEKRPPHEFIDVGIVMDPIADIKPYKDSSFAMLLEAQRRGHQLHYMEPTDLFLKNGRPFAETTELKVWDRAKSDTTSQFYGFGASHETDLSELDIILIRQDPPFNNDYLYATHMLELAEAQACW